ncbi:MAG: phosphodiester glycosidase family protein [Clostridia bacterium]|nr:phosphodiester glycosidase family protein [Clostridia bacterium]
MKNTFFSRAVALLLVAVLMMGVLPMSVFAAEAAAAPASENEQVSTYQSVKSTLAPGITQTINSAYAADGKLINYYIAVADINRDDVGIHTTYKDAQCTVGGMAKMTEQAASMVAKHSNPNDAANYIPYYAIVAGVNGDGYNTGSGIPSGAHVTNGVAGFGISKAGNSSWFAIFEDGTALCGANNADWDEAVAAHGPAQEAIGGFQLVRKNGVDCSYNSNSYLNDGRYPRSFVGVTADNKVVFMTADGNGAGGSAGTNWKESVEIMDEAGCTYILCLDGGGSATYISRPAGSNDVQVTSNPSDGSERAVSNGLVMYTTTPPSDTFSYATITAANEYVTAGAKVKVSATGISPAGTAAAIPENAIWSATNGSVENGVFISDGTVGDAVVSLLVDGKVVGSATIHVVVPETIAFTRDKMVVPFGGTVTLEIVAKYGLHDVLLKDGDVTFSVTDETVGTVNDGKFTAAESGEETVITATFVGSNVTDTVTVTLGKGSEVIFDFEAGTKGADLNNWWLSNAVGANKDQYTVAELEIVTPETGKVHSGSQALAFRYPMDEALHGTEFWAGNSLVWDGESIELKNAVRIGFWLYIPEDATQFAYFMGVTTHDENGKMNGRVGSSVECYNENDMREYSGWHYVSMELGGRDVYIENNVDQVGQSFNGSQFKWKANCFFEFYAVNIESWEKNETNYAGDFTFYIDDITVDYSDAVDDRENPIFGDMTYAVEGMSDAAALNGQTVNKNIVDFAVNVAEDMTNPNNASGLDASSVVAYIDGLEVDCEYANGLITISGAALTDGVHTIRIGISDKMGNYSETKRQITVKTENDDASVRVQPQDKDLIYMLNGSVYWIDVEVDAIESVQSVEMKLDLDSMNNWKLDQMTVLSGFDCEWEFATANDKAENIVTVTLTRNGYLSAKGTETVASLPIRVWDYVSSDDHVHANAVEAWKCNYVCAPALSVDVDTEMGMVTYLDGSSHSFSSENIHTLCVSYTYGVYLRDYNKDFYNTHSYHVHSAVAMTDLAATCTEDGYTGRTWCDTCNSPVDWGTNVKATSHTYTVVDGVLKCACGERFNGVYTDGKTYTDGVANAGWIGESYYVDGVALTGVQLVDGYYYDFGEDGVCSGQMKYNGLFYDETVSAWRYAKVGELVGGWIKIGDYWHYFNTTTKVAVTGVKHWGPVFTFDETGKTEGAWYQTAEGTRFYYGPDYYVARNNNQAMFVEIDGKTYNFDKSGYATTGIHALYDDWAYMTRGEMRVWEFDENGALIGEITTKGVIDNQRGGLYLIEDDGFVHGGKADGQIRSYNGDFYFVLYSGKLVTDASRWVSASVANGLLSAGTYYFGKDGKLQTFNGIQESADGTLYYYEDDKLATGIYNSELVEIDGSIYLVKWSGKVAVNETRFVPASATNGLISAGTYEFGADGKLVRFNGIKEGADGALYYYEDGKLASGLYNSELVEIDGSIYLVKWSGKVAVNETRFVPGFLTNGLTGAGVYDFGADGKLFNGVKEGADGELYFYENGQVATGLYNSELVKLNGSIYLVKFSGKVAANETRFVHASKTNGLISAGTYTFGADGKMEIPFTGVKPDGDILYYYKDGKLGSGLYNSELVEIDGSIYLVKFSGKVAANETRFVAASKTNGLIGAGTYTFGADGKLAK